MHPRACFPSVRTVWQVIERIKLKQGLAQKMLNNWSKNAKEHRRSTAIGRVVQQGQASDASRDIDDAAEELQRITQT